MAQESDPPQQGAVAPHVQTRRLQSVVIRFAGDSGDGMQITGNQFTQTSAFVKKSRVKTGVQNSRKK